MAGQTLACPGANAEPSGSRVAGRGFGVAASTLAAPRPCPAAARTVDAGHGSACQKGGPRAGAMDGSSRAELGFAGTVKPRGMSEGQQKGRRLRRLPRGRVFGIEVVCQKCRVPLRLLSRSRARMNLSGDRGGGRMA